MKSFHIYKSSAGSGKTSQLVLSYLKLCLGNDNPTNYRRILAITFTNKAANEMKERLIKELLKISTLSESGKHDYMVESLLSDLKIDLKTLEARAKAVFKDLLQAYEQLGISTIDKFNHILIKSFSRDLDIPSDFEVETAEKEIFSEAVEELIAQVGIDKHISKHLINYVQYSLDEESKVNIRQSLEGLFSLSVGESSYRALDEIAEVDKDRFEALAEQLHSEIEKGEAQLRDLGKEALKLIHSAGLAESDFIHGKNGVYGFFQKVASNNIKDLSFSKRAENALAGSWMAKSASGDQLDSLSKIQTELESILLAIENFFRDRLNSLLLKKSIRSNIDLIAVLTGLSEKFKEICERRKVIPISRFNKLISDALRKEPVSFIYEQIGARYDHILIDEFQDTSQLQWYNLLPLLDESISRGKYNMIVGDAKQSIYRWRGGKAEQLIALPRLFEPPVDLPVEIQQNLEYNAAINHLNVNYRSLDKIVAFNNRLVENLAAEAIDQNTLYASEYNTDSFKQKHSEGKSGGFIEVSQLDNSDQKNEWKNLHRQIIICKERGYDFGDMAILVRSAKKEGKSITRTLLSKGVPVVSNESYDIGEYLPVKITLAFLRLSLDQKHNPSKVQIIKGLSQLMKKDPAYGKYTSGKQINLDAFLLDSDQKAFKTYAHLSAFDAIEEIHSDYLHELDHPAFNTLKESVFTRFGLKGSIAEFLDSWDEQRDKPSINFGDSGNSVELLTIHKAKGLQYKVVFLPEMSWKLRAGHNQFSWFSMKNQPIDLPYAPLKINKSLVKIGLEEEFNREEHANHFDNLNLAYVALTRAEEALFINTHSKSGGTIGSWMEKALEALLNGEDQSEFDPKIEITEFGRIISIGSLNEPKNEKQDEESNNSKPLRLHPWKQGLEFADLRNNKMQKLGNVFHELISKAQTPVEFRRLVDRKHQIGQIKDHEKGFLTELSESLFSSDTFHQIIRDGNVIAEREIFYQGKIIRPDMIIEKESEQVVLDFKTGIEKPIHKDQIAEYMSACRILGPKNVKGYLVYLDPLKFIPVESSEANLQMNLF